MSKYIAILIPALLLASFTFACGGGSSKTVKIPGGGEISSSSKLPDSFPGDFPIYSGAKVQGSVSGSQGGVSGTTVSWQTGDSVSKVTDFYTGKFKDGPWKSS